MILNKKQKILSIIFVILLSLQFFGLSQRLSWCVKGVCVVNQATREAQKTHWGYIKDEPKYRSQSSVIQGFIFYIIGEILLFGLLFYVLRSKNEK